MNIQYHIIDLDRESQERIVINLRKYLMEVGAADVYAPCFRSLPPVSTKIYNFNIVNMPSQGCSYSHIIFILDRLHCSRTLYKMNIYHFCIFYFRWLDKLSKEQTSKLFGFEKINQVDVHNRNVFHYLFFLASPYFDIDINSCGYKLCLLRKDIYGMTPNDYMKPNEYSNQIYKVCDTILQTKSDSYIRFQKNWYNSIFSCNTKVSKFCHWVHQLYGIDLTIKVNRHKYKLIRKD